jgi:hypothetical protein
MPMRKSQRPWRKTCRVGPPGRLELPLAPPNLWRLPKLGSGFPSPMPMPMTLRPGWPGRRTCPFEEASKVGPVPEERRRRPSPADPCRRRRHQFLRWRPTTRCARRGRQTCPAWEPAVSASVFASPPHSTARSGRRQRHPLPPGRQTCRAWQPLVRGRRHRLKQGEQQQQPRPRNRPRERRSPAAAAAAAAAAAEPELQICRGWATTFYKRLQPEDRGRVKDAGVRSSIQRNKRVLDAKEDTLKIRYCISGDVQTISRSPFVHFTFLVPSSKIDHGG